MDSKRLRALLTSLASGEISVEAAEARLSDFPMEDIHYAHIDHHRSLRKGFPEVIFGEGKTADQITGILERMVPREDVVLVTRIDAGKAEEVTAVYPYAVYHSDARMLVIEKKRPEIRGRGCILVICAGTSDIPVAKEAALTARAMGHEVETLYDVGVAGIHRLFAYKDQIRQANVLVVVAGMEGALPSVVAGMVGRPVIAVPTSIGYGASFGGITALLAMLNSCSSNVAVVNIDNGFGAGYMAAIINQR